MTPPAGTLLGLDDDAHLAPYNEFPAGVNAAESRGTGRPPTPIVTGVRGWRQRKMTPEAPARDSQ